MSRCFNCIRYKGSLTCEAYPKGIPEEIITGKVDHDSPYEGDKGKTYQPVRMNPLGLALQKVIEEKGDG